MIELKVDGDVDVADISEKAAIVTKIFPIKTGSRTTAMVEFGVPGSLIHPRFQRIGPNFCAFTFFRTALLSVDFAGSESQQSGEEVHSSFSGLRVGVP